MTAEPVTWSETRARLRADRERIREWTAQMHDGESGSIWCHPSWVCVVLFRLSHYFHRRGSRLVARFFWHLNTFLTGADISEPADIGPGLLVMCPAGTAIMGKAGRNLTVMACAGMGGEVGRSEDVGGGRGVPVVGDDVIIEPHAGVLGPVRVGSRVRVPAGIGLTQDVPDDTDVQGPRPRFLRRRTE